VQTVPVPYDVLSTLPSAFKNCEEVPPTFVILSALRPSVALMPPDTVSFSPGAVVPIPMLPSS